MAAIEHSSLDVKLKRVDRIYRPGEVVEGILIINAKSGWSHNGISLQVRPAASPPPPPPPPYTHRHTHARKHRTVPPAKALATATTATTRFATHSIYQVVGQAKLQLSARSVGLFESMSNLKPLVLMELPVVVLDAGVSAARCHSNNRPPSPRIHGHHLPRPTSSISPPTPVTTYRPRPSRPAAGRNNRDTIRVSAAFGGTARVIPWRLH